MNKYKKIIVIILVCVIGGGCTFTALDSNENTSLQTNKETLPEPNRGSESNGKYAEELQTIITNRDIDYSKFKFVKECGKIIFPIEESEKNIVLNLQVNQTPKQIKLFIEQDDNIMHVVYEKSSYIFEYVNQGYVVDLNKEDIYKELVIEGYGIGGNPYTTILRISEKELVSLDTIQDIIKIDQQGNLLKLQDVINFSPSPLIGMIYNISETGLHEANRWSETIEFDLKEQVSVSFFPKATDQEEDIDVIRSFDTGTKFIIYSYMNEGVWEVEINGVRGYMSLKIAG